MTNRGAVLFIAALLAGCGESTTSAPQADPASAISVDPSSRPNILLVVADDLGFTDLGAFGGEIPTPNLDRLAFAGTRLSNFHTSASCAPTRAMLLTGTDNHLAGMGSQSGLATPLQQQHEAYQNKLSPNVKTIATRLQSAGYRTYASAKWHLGTEAPQLPGRRGFDRSLVLAEGGGGHFDDMPLFERYGKAHWLLDDEPLELPEDFYSTAFMTDRLIEFIGSDERQDQPFFAYLGYTAPHWPLQAPAEKIAAHRGRYDAGYEVLLDERMAGARRMGVVPESAVGVTSNPGVVPWSELSMSDQQAYRARMVAYAAMVDSLDEHVGRLLTFLEVRGDLENTLVVFIVDNGAEGHAIEFRESVQDWLAANFDNSVDNIGNRNSYVTLGAGWARATAAPFRASKSKVSEGGIRVPAFVYFPKELPSPGSVDDAFMTVMDLAPTFLEFAGAPTDDQIRGRSLKNHLLGSTAAVYGPQETVAWEVYGRRAVHMGPWKLLLQEAPFGTGDWELHNLDSDLGEQIDVAAQHPEIFEHLKDEWQAYADEVGVVLPETPIGY